MFNSYVIVVGASAGGVDALSKLVSHIPADLPAAVFIVMHLKPYSESRLPVILNRVSKLPAMTPVDGQTIEHGQIYIAPPNQHMLIVDGCIRLRHGPKVNYWRPAIDPLFRSAAIAYDSKVIGIVLSGMLDDGSAGLLAIKRRGGITIVQDLEEAQFPDMPRNALTSLPIDYCLPAADIATLLTKLVKKPVVKKARLPASDLMKLETSMNLTTNEASEEDMNKLGKPSVFICPECHGTLWEIQYETFLRFRCRVGHAYGLESLSAGINGKIEEALWVALRALEEKTNLAESIAEKARRDKVKTALHFTQKAQGTRGHAQVIREILLSDSKNTK